MADQDPYDVGDTTELFFTTKNKITEEFENPTGVKLSVKPPGTGVPAVEYEWPGGAVIENPSPGHFTAEVPLVAKGWWTYFWESTGALASAEPGELYVRPKPL